MERDEALRSLSQHVQQVKKAGGRKFRLRWAATLMGRCWMISSVIYSYHLMGRWNFHLQAKEKWTICPINLSICRCPTLAG